MKSQKYRAPNVGIQTLLLSIDGKYCPNGTWLWKKNNNLDINAFHHNILIPLPIVVLVSSGKSIQILVIKCDLPLLHFCSTLHTYTQTDGASSFKAVHYQTLIHSRHVCCCQKLLTPRCPLVDSFV